MIQPGDTLSSVFAVQNAAGTTVVPDGPPVVTIWRNKTPDPTVTVTVTPTDTPGLYGYAFTIPSTYAVDDTVTVVVTAVLDGDTLGPTPVNTYIIAAPAAPRGVTVPAMPTACAPSVRANPGCNVDGGGGDIATAVIRYGAGGRVVFPLATPDGFPAAVGEGCEAPVIRAGMADAVLRASAQDLEAEVDDDGRGIRVVIPPDTRPGVYQVEALCSAAVPEGWGPVRATSRGLLYVEPSAVFGPPSGSGLPQIDEVRQAVRDHPAARRLLGDYEFGAAEIVGAIRRAVAEFNGIPPPVIQMPTQQWPASAQQPLLDGVLAQLYETAAAYYRANFLPYQAGGVAVNDTAKEREYLNASLFYRQRWERWVKTTKIGVNIATAYGSSRSGYFRGSRYPGFRDR